MIILYISFFFLDLIWVSVNTRGLRNIVKRKAFFLFCKEAKADFVFLQESHSCSEDETFCKKQWGKESWFSHGSNRSAGVTILKDKFNGKVLDKRIDDKGHYIFLVLEIHTNFVLIGNI